MNLYQVKKCFLFFRFLILLVLNLCACFQRSDTPALNLCLKLTKRGPDAYNNFLNALREAKQDNVIIPILNQTRSTLDQPPHMLIPTRDSTVTVNSCCNNSLNNGNNGGISISDFKFPNNSPIESSLSPTSAEYRLDISCSTQFYF